MRTPGSSLDVWFRDDIQNALCSVDISNADICELIPHRDAAIYRRGYLTALRSIAAVFGIEYDYPLWGNLDRRVR